MVLEYTCYLFHIDFEVCWLYFVLWWCCSSFVGTVWMLVAMNMVSLNFSLSSLAFYVLSSYCYVWRCIGWSLCTGPCIPKYEDDSSSSLLPAMSGFEVTLVDIFWFCIISMFWFPRFGSLFLVVFLVIMYFEHGILYLAICLLMPKLLAREVS